VCGPVEVKTVENLWMIGEFPVDGRDGGIFFRPRRSKNDSDARDVRAFAIRFA